MIGQLLGQEDEFSLRLHRRRAFVPVERVDCQCPIDQDRLLFVFREEVEASSQTSRPRLRRLVHDRVGPHRGDGLGGHRLFIVIEPVESAVRIEFRTPRQERRHEADEHHDKMTFRLQTADLP